MTEKAGRSARRKASEGVPGFPLRVAAVDVGSNAIRSVIAEFRGARDYAVVAAERYPVRLGHDVFLTGRLTEDAMTAAVGALASSAELLKAHGVTLSRAVATSAVRESKNGELFLQRVRDRTGLNLGVISGQEEARLVYLAVRNRVDLGADRWILVDVGGGSVEVSLVDGAGIMWSESHTMGSVRLLEELATAGGEPGHFGQILSEYVSTLRIAHPGWGPPAAALIATGGSAETIVKLVGSEVGAGGVATLGLGELRAVLATLSRLSFRQRVDELGLREDRADVILPAAIVYERLCTLTSTEHIVVPHVGIGEGVLFDLVDEVTTTHDHEVRREQELWATAVALGRRYAFDEVHGAQVARLALSLFDQLARPLKLARQDRRFLLASALLHDVGAYVSYKRHHKHSLYLISSSELPGFSPRDMLVVGNVARYHRKGEPEAQHEPFARLTADEQRRVTVLAAILRVADGLDREHAGRVTSVRVELKGGQLRLALRGQGDLLLERWAVQRKSDLLADVFGLKVKIVT